MTEFTPILALLGGIVIGLAELAALSFFALRFLSTLITEESTGSVWVFPSTQRFFHWLLNPPKLSNGFH